MTDFSIDNLAAGGAIGGTDTYPTTQTVGGTRTTVKQTLTNLAAFVASFFGPADGQCYLVRTSATQVTLSAEGGGALVVGTTQQQVPAGGVVGTLNSSSTPATAANTFFYIYAAMSGTGGAMLPEFSTTGWAYDTKGRKTKSGDTARRLVGACMTDGSGNIVQVISRFNERYTQVASALTGDVATTSTSGVQVFTALKAISWADRPARWEYAGFAYNGDNATQGYLTLQVDGNNVTSNPGVYFSVGAAGAGYCMPISDYNTPPANLLPSGDGTIHTYGIKITSTASNTEHCQLHYTLSVWG